MQKNESLGNLYYTTIKKVWKIYFGDPMEFYNMHGRVSGKEALSKLSDIQLGVDLEILPFWGKDTF